MVADVFQQLLAGVASGGAAATTTFLSVFKHIKDRISKLEKALGKRDTDPPTGVFYQIESNAKNIWTLKNEIDSWRESPPEWLVRIVLRANRGIQSNEQWHELEQRVETRLNSFKHALQRLEDDLERRERRLTEELEKSIPESRDFILREEYEQDSKMRAEELHRVRESLRSANSFLRGVMAAMGYVDPETNEVPTPDEVPSSAPPPRFVPKSRKKL